MKNLTQESTQLLKQLISIPSFSKEESGTAAAIAGFMERKGIPVQRKGNNVWAMHPLYDPSRPTLLLNSHHDTVKSQGNWITDPFTPVECDGKITGLGSNDAGASLVSLLAAFLYYHERSLPFNVVFAATAEEEISGKDGIESVLPELCKIDFAIVGEPTGMNIAVAEKGLLVVDCLAKGMAGHAARNEGINAILEAIKDIQWVDQHSFPLTSEWLGEVKMSTTVIHAGQQHNCFPDECRFTIDIRVTDVYTLEEVLSTLRQNMRSEITPRSLRIKPSRIETHHPLVRSGVRLGKNLYGSPTTSDQALMTFPSIKMGPGDSARSHTANEFIYVQEIEDGIRDYIQLLKNLSEELTNNNTNKFDHEDLAKTIQTG